MTGGDNTLSSQGYNTLFESEQKRRERSTMRINDEKNIIQKGSPWWSYALILTNLIAAALMGYSLTVSGLDSATIDVFGFPLNIPGLFAGLAVAAIVYKSNTYAASLNDYQGKVAKVAIAFGLVVTLGMSVISTQFTGTALFESATGVAETSANKQDQTNKAIAAVSARADAARQLYESVKEERSTAHRNLLSAQNTYNVAVVAKADWRERIIKKYGDGSAAMNRRNDPNHKETKEYNKTISDAATERQRAQSVLASIQPRVDQAYKTLSEATDDLNEARLRMANNIDKPQAFARAAASMGGVVGWTEKEFVVAFMFAIALIGSCLTPLEYFAAGASNKPMMANAAKHKRFQQARNAATEIMQRDSIQPQMPVMPAIPPISTPVEQVVHAAPPSQPPAPTPAPANDIGLLMQTYRGKIADALHDAQSGILHSASVIPLKEKYGTGDQGAKAIRHALVDAGFATWTENNQCKMNG